MRILGVNWLPVLTNDMPLAQTYAVNVWITSESIPTIPTPMKRSIAQTELRQPKANSSRQSNQLTNCSNSFAFYINKHSSLNTPNSARLCLQQQESSICPPTRT